jgi:hypothetical protein
MWNSLLLILPDHKLGVVLLNNSAENAGNVNFQIAITILEQALKVKTGIEPPPAEPPAVVALTAEELRSYEGNYTTNLGWMNIRSDGTDLYADALGQSFKLLPHGGGRFSLEGVSPSDAQMVIKEVNGRTAVYLYGLVVEVTRLSLVLGRRAVEATKRLSAAGRYPHGDRRTNRVSHRAALGR